MKFSFSDWLIAGLGQWLVKNDPPHRSYLCDFDQIVREIKIGDVLLVEGRNRASRIIQQITLSPWTHAAIYIGNLNQIKDPKSYDSIQKYAAFTIAGPLIMESEIGAGTIVAPLSKYRDDHIRILRPQGLSEADCRKVVTFAIASLGRKYDVRHVLDLARFLLPWGLFPRSWRSSLFQHNAQQPTEDICSSMIADAFHSIHYPILPLVRLDLEKNIELIQRNPRLFTPSDFDYSPYFDVIKYPIFKLGKDITPENLPWRTDVVSDDIGLEVISSIKKPNPESD